MFTLPPLPYADNALEPVISANTLSFHHGKHHKTYVDNLNNLIKGTELEGQSLEQIVTGDGRARPTRPAIFNNAAQVWNHTFYWNSLRPGGGGKPTGKLAQMIDQAFGSYDKFKKEFVADQRHAVRLGLGLAGRRRRRAQGREDAATPRRRSPRARSRCSRSTCGSTRTTSTTRTGAPTYVDAVIDKLLNWDFAAREPRQGVTRGARAEQRSRASRTRPRPGGCCPRRSPSGQRTGCPTCGCAGR